MKAPRFRFSHGRWITLLFGIAFLCPLFGESLYAQGGALRIVTANLPGGVVGTPYSAQQLNAEGGTPGYTWSVIASLTLPPGLSLSGAGVLSGTPTAAGLFSFSVQVSDSATARQTVVKGFTLNVNLPTPPSITTASPLPVAAVGSAYLQMLAASGGTPGVGGYSWAVGTSSILPAGLNLSGAGVLSGTPTAAGSFGFNVTVSDSGAPPQTAMKNFTLIVSPPPPPSIITPSPLPETAVGATYLQTLAASGGTPGAGGYTWAVGTSSILPAGLSLSAAGVLSGMPTTAGSFSFTLQVSDRGTPVQTGSRTFALRINPAPLITSPSRFPDGVAGAAYLQTLTASGGTPGAGGYAWSLASGVLPGGLSLSAAGALAGIPAAAGGPVSFTIRLTDSSAPVQAVLKDFTLKINPQLLITTPSALSEGMAGAAYSQTLAASGGTSAYSWFVVGGAPPAGLSLSAGGVLSGTPAAAGSFSFTARVADSSIPSQSVQRDFVVTIKPAPLSITTASPLPLGTVGVAYSQTLAASGGTPGYTWSVAGSLLPAGLTLSPTGVLSGIPTAAGSRSFTVQATDIGTPVQTVQKVFELTVNGGPPAIITASPLPVGTVGIAYSQTLAATGGTPGYTWSVVAGSVLPAGLSLSETGVLSGTPTGAGLFNFTIRVTDSSASAQSGQKGFSLTINLPPSITSASPLPAGAVGIAYSQTLAASGGTPGYTWSLVPSSFLPPGLNLSGAGVISGTPTTAGSFSFTIRVTDSGVPAQSAQKTFTQTINFAPAPLSITTASPLPAAAVGNPYSPTLAASGGTPGYTWSLVPGSFLPGGLSLSGVGVLSGTPTTAGLFSFAIRVTDNSNPTQTAQRVFDLTINPPPVSPLITTLSQLPNGAVGTAYSQTLAANGGTPGYTWSVVAGSVLPAGLNLSGAGVLSGTPTATGSFSFAIRVTDSSTPAQTASQIFALLIDTPSIPSLTLTGVPSEMNPTQQLGIGLALSAPYPQLLSGTLRISFASRAIVPLDDPMVLFSTGSRAVNFTIPANGTVAVLPSQLAVFTGTVAGTITFTAEIPGRASQLVGSVDIRSISPQIVGNVAAVRTAGGLRVAITGYSAERRVLRADFVFRVRTGTSVQNVSLTRDVATEFENWYRNSASSTFGSSFVFVQSFAVQGDSTAIEAVTITLTNGQGSTSSSLAVFTN